MDYYVATPRVIQVGLERECIAGLPWPAAHAICEAERDDKGGVASRRILARLAEHYET